MYLIANSTLDRCWKCKEFRFGFNGNVTEADKTKSMTAVKKDISVL